MKKLAFSLSTLLLGLCLIATSAFADTKPKLIFVYQDNCRMCHDFKNAVLLDPSVKKELEKFNFSEVNANAGKIDVEVTPTIIIYDKNNKQIKKFVPSTDKKKFLEILKKSE